MYNYANNAKTRLDCMNNSALIIDWGACSSFESFSSDIRIVTAKKD